MDNFGGTNKRRVAYRYQEVENPHAPTGQQPYLLITYTKRGRPAQTVMNSKFTAKAQSQWKVFNRVAFQVDAVHLGEQFIGGIDDIANVSFWENTSLRKETRIIPTNYTSYDIEGWSSSPIVVESGAYYWLSNFSDVVRTNGMDWNKSPADARYSPVMRFSCRPFTTQEHP